MTKWPKRDRPRERLRKHGPAALSDSEVLALLLGTGSGQENALEVARGILVQGGGLEVLARLGLAELMRIAGVGEAKASRIMAGVELGFRIVEQAEKMQISCCFESSADIYELYKTRLALLREERFMVVGLNSRNQPVHEVVVAQGSVNECRVAPASVFRPMIVEAAARAVLLHNHPSGDPTPSPHDVALTRRLVTVGRAVGIPILDHIVIGRNAYSSMRDLGLLAE